MERQDVAFSYLFIPLFTDRKKELKACVLLWCGKSSLSARPSLFVSFMFHAGEKWSLADLDHTLVTFVK